MALSVEKKLRKALAVAGNIYTLEDVLHEVLEGNMQSFAEGESWVVTQIVDFPQKRYLEILFAVGNLHELKALYPSIEAFARDNLCDGMRAFGRQGWMRQFEIDRAGWVETTRTYVKEF